jgi:hypothetical protein
MRDPDRVHITSGLHGSHRGVVDERDHVPDDIALRRLGEQQPLADRELRRDADPEVAGVVADVAAALRAQLLQRRPALAAETDVLALVEADRARLGRYVRRRVVGRTGEADRDQGVRR